MHAHMISPFRFVEDLAVRPADTAVWNAGIVFPLRRLSAVLMEGSWLDKVSEERWNEYTKNIRYQMWDSDPLLGGSYTLVTPFLRCIKCSEGMEFSSELWISYRVDNQGVFCGKCGKFHTMAAVKMQNLHEDIAEYIRNPDSDSACKSIKGAGIDMRTGSPRYRQVATDFRRLELSKTTFWSSLNSGDPQQRKWEKMFDAARATHVRSVESEFPVNDRNLLTATCRIYLQSSALQFLSIDLVAAVFRQQTFARKIIALSNWDDMVILNPMSDRYLKFMLLMKKPAGGRVRSLVPTLDVDLFWHTHQLFPKYYHSWCVQNVGRRINHDDTIEETQLKTSFDDTRKIWRAAYGEDYIVGHEKIQSGSLSSLPSINGESSPESKPSCNNFHHVNSEDASQKQTHSVMTVKLNETEQDTLLKEMTVPAERIVMGHELARRGFEARLNAMKDPSNSDPAKMILPAMIRVAVETLSKEWSQVISRKLDVLSLFPAAIAVLKKMGDKAAEELEKRLTNDESRKLTIYDLLPTEGFDIMDWYLAKLFVEDQLALVERGRAVDNNQELIVLVDDTRTATSSDTETKVQALREVASQIESRLARLRSKPETQNCKDSTRRFDEEKWAAHLKIAYPKLFRRTLQDSEATVQSMLNVAMAEAERASHLAAQEELAREEAAAAAMESELGELRLRNVQLQGEVRRQPEVSSESDSAQRQQDNLERSAQRAEQRARERIEREELERLDQRADWRAEERSLERAEQRMRMLNLTSRLAAERDASRRQAEEMEALLDRRREELSTMLERRRREAQALQAVGIVSFSLFSTFVNLSPNLEIYCCWGFLCATIYPHSTSLSPYLPDMISEPTTPNGPP